MITLSDDFKLRGIVRVTFTLGVMYPASYSNTTPVDSNTTQVGNAFFKTLLLRCRRDVVSAVRS